MKVIVHRGGQQVGGTIIEIATGNCKVFLDLGSSLYGSESCELSRSEISQLTRDADAIFYSHSHTDHVGLFRLVPENVPQYIGSASRDLLLHTYTALDRHIDKEESLSALKRMRTYCVGTPIDVASKGEIVITPYLVSHSAYDSYMLKVEVGRVKLLYMGDFRQHGYLGKGLMTTLKKYIGEVDLLIIEGTLLGRRDELPLHESVVKTNICRILMQHKYVFALCSSTHADRLASFHEACRQTGRLFLVDSYLKGVMEILTKYGGKHSALYRFDRFFELINYKTPRVQRKLRREGFLMPIRASMINKVRGMLKLYNDEEPWLIYSMWRGYLTKGAKYGSEGLADIAALFGENILEGTKDGLHTSGHADISTLEKVCKAVHPRCGIIPIHKEPDTQLESLPALCSYRILRVGYWKIGNITISIS